MASTIIGTGNQFRFFSEDVVAYDNLPVGVYEVCFSKMVGYWVERPTLSRARRERSSTATT